jgi:hypothetical protein
MVTSAKVRSRIAPGPSGYVRPLAAFTAEAHEPPRPGRGTLRFVASGVQCPVLGRLGIDFAAGKLGQRIVGFLLLGQRLIEKADRILHAQLACP